MLGIMHAPDFQESAHRQGTLSVIAVAAGALCTMAHVNFCMHPF